MARVPAAVEALPCPFLEVEVPVLVQGARFLALALALAQGAVPVLVRGVRSLALALALVPAWALEAAESAQIAYTRIYV